MVRSNLSEGLEPSPDSLGSHEITDPGETPWKASCLGIGTQRKKEPTLLNKVKWDACGLRLAAKPDD